MGMITTCHLAESGGRAGGETYLLLLARRLDRARFRLIVAVPEHGPLERELRAEGIETVTVDLRVSHCVGFIRQLRSLLRSARVHILQSHGARTNVYARVVGRLSGTPVIISTVHNLLFDYPIGRLLKLLYVTVDRLSAPLAHATICVAESHRQTLLHHYRLSPGTVITVPNGVDVKRFSPVLDGGEFRQEQGIPPDAPLIGVIGRLTPQKGHDLLIRALLRLMARVPRVHCLIVGDGELLDALRRLAAQQGVAQQCRFLGVRQDIPRILSALDVLVIPSRSEGLPYVALEGMAMAKPVVATSVNGLRELIQDGRTGRLIPREDPQALADAIESLLRDSRRAAALGQAARRLVEEEYSVERWITRMEELYERLYAQSCHGNRRPGLEG